MFIYVAFDSEKLDVIYGEEAGSIDGTRSRTTKVSQALDRISSPSCRARSCRGKIVAYKANCHVMLAVFHAESESSDEDEEKETKNTTQISISAKVLRTDKRFSSRTFLSLALIWRGE